MTTRTMILISMLWLGLTSLAHADEAPGAAPPTAWALPTLQLSAQLELLPAGTAKTTARGAATSGDAELAYGVSAGVEYLLHPLLSIGVSPRLVLHVQPEAATTDARQEIDLRAVARAHYPMTPALEAYAALTPGWAIVVGGGDAMDTAHGLVLGGAGGVRLAVSPSLFVSAEVGYQRAFTRGQAGPAGATADADVDLSYVHVGLGAGARF